MTLQLLFWILMLFMLLGIGWYHRADWRGGGISLLVFLLFLVLGWGTFGAPIKG